MLEPLTDRQATLVVNNVVKACKAIDKLNSTGYKFINLASGFIAHYNLHGFKCHYSNGSESLRSDILAFRSQNKYGILLSPGDQNYEYYRQKGIIYNLICEKIAD